MNINWKTGKVTNQSLGPSVPFPQTQPHFFMPHDTSLSYLNCYETGLIKLLITHLQKIS
jgi:hypothetical protein